VRRADRNAFPEPTGRSHTTDRLREENSNEKKRWIRTGVHRTSAELRPPSASKRPRGSGVRPLSRRATAYSAPVFEASGEVDGSLTVSAPLRGAPVPIGKDGIRACFGTTSRRALLPGPWPWVAPRGLLLADRAPRGPLDAFPTWSRVRWRQARPARGLLLTVRSRWIGKRAAAGRLFLFACFARRRAPRSREKTSTIAGDLWKEGP